MYILFPDCTEMFRNFSLVVLFYNYKYLNTKHKASKNLILVLNIKRYVNKVH